MKFQVRTMSVSWQEARQMKDLVKNTWAGC